MANGKLRCLGSAQHLKTKFGQGFQLEMKIAMVSKEDEDFQTNHSALISHTAGENTTSESAEDEVSFNLQQVQGALKQLTEDDFLSSMLNESNPAGFSVLKEASSPLGVLSTELALFATSEIRMRRLHSFVDL